MTIDQNLLTEVIEDIYALDCLEEILVPDDRNECEYVVGVILKADISVQAAILNMILDYKNWFESLGDTANLTKGALLALDEEDFERRRNLGRMIVNLLLEGQLITLSE